MDKRVLIVEDSPTMRQMIAMVVRRAGSLQIDEAGDGVAGLRQMKAQKYDLIITDINMPLLDGLKLVSLIRQDERHRDTPIVVITTEGSDEHRNQAFALGATSYITKPIKGPDVAKKVKELLA